MASVFHNCPIHILSLVLPAQAAAYDQQPEATAAPGFAGLLKGTDNIKGAFVTDRGFCKEIAKKYQKLGVKSPRQWCTDNNVPFFYPYKEGDEDGLMYDALRHTITVVPQDEAPVSLGNSWPADSTTQFYLDKLTRVLYHAQTPCVQGPATNWSRYVTYLRAAVEQLHAALWGVYPGLQRRQADNMNAVGMGRVNKYFNW